MKKLMLAALLGVASVAHAQDGGLFESTFNRYVTYSFSAHYALSMPLGGQKNYIDRISPANLVLQGEAMFPGQFSIGAKSGYQYAQQRLPRQVYTIGDQSISAVQTRTLTIVPALLTASYYFTPNNAALRPYVQLAGGGAYVDDTRFYGSLADGTSGFRGAFAPAVGVKYYRKKERGLGGEIQAQYQQIGGQDSGFGNSQSLLISAGITFRGF
ncbi:MAG: hypothetical protein H7Z72_22710 [Bacteroidetes bacterium]|nr:hypothetical protein [Fibrella sp.]